jgi:toxin FitB
MRLIDTNLIIYAAQPNYRWLLPLITTTDSHFTTISKIEVLGFKGIQQREKVFFELYFSGLISLGLTDEIVEKTIEIRGNKKMKLGDSIIAATALIHNLELHTHNIDDFKSIRELALFDPMP